MTIARTPLMRRVTAGLGIAALASAALLGSMLPANAADTSPTVGNIDSGASKSLTIHKFAQPANQGTAPDGNELPAEATSGLTGLAGVGFKIQKVTGIDLATATGWADTVDLKPADVAGQLVDVAEDVTNKDGVLTFTNLEQVLYLVTETNPGANNVAFAAAPFLVTLPLPDKANNSWIYNVHVYPKNSLASITKTVDDSAATGLGSAVTWNIKADVPHKSADTPLTKFTISDTLDTRLGYQSATVTLASGAVVSEGTDFTIDTTTVANTVTVSFTTDGLAKFAADETVHVALVTTVNSLGDTSGVIANTATVFTNDKSFDSETVQTVWGNVIIHKVDNSATPKSLDGAEFKVYATEADAKADTNAIKVSGQDVFTSKNGGIVAIDGLRANNNGVGEAITYWLVETKAPVGYKISNDVSASNPKSFTVDSTITTAIDITVANSQVPPFMLPLTGGSGTAMFMTVGLGLLAVAGGVALRKRSTRRVA